MGGHVYKNDYVNNISELKEAGISIYLNPSSGIFNIKNAKDYDITITDITGKVIYRAPRLPPMSRFIYSKEVFISLILNHKPKTFRLKLL